MSTRLFIFMKKRIIRKEEFFPDSVQVVSLYTKRNEYGVGIGEG